MVDTSLKKFSVSDMLFLTLAWRCRALRFARVRFCVLDAFFPCRFFWPQCGGLCVCAFNEFRPTHATASLAQELSQ